MYTALEGVTSNPTEPWLTLNIFLPLPPLCWDYRNEQVKLDLFFKMM